MSQDFPTFFKAATGNAPYDAPRKVARSHGDRQPVAAQLGCDSAAPLPTHLRIRIIQISLQFREVVGAHDFPLCEQQFKIPPNQPGQLRRLPGGKRPARIKRQRKFLPNLMLNLARRHSECIGDSIRDFKSHQHTPSVSASRGENKIRLSPYNSPSLPTP